MMSNNHRSASVIILYVLAYRRASGEYSSDCRILEKMVAIIQQVTSRLILHMGSNIPIEE
jgi:hypothetical protein